MPAARWITSDAIWKGINPSAGRSLDSLGPSKVEDSVKFHPAIVAASIKPSSVRSMFGLFDFNRRILF
jgi:hypothetical protein